MVFRFFFDFLFSMPNQPWYGGIISDLKKKKKKDLFSCLNSGSNVPAQNALIHSLRCPRSARTVASMERNLKISPPTSDKLSNISSGPANTIDEPQRKPKVCFGPKHTLYFNQTAITFSLSLFCSIEATEDAESCSGILLTNYPKTSPMER